MAIILKMMTLASKLPKTPAGSSRWFSEEGCISEIPSCQPKEFCAILTELGSGQLRQNRKRPNCYRFERQHATYIYIHMRIVSISWGQHVWKENKPELELVLDNWAATYRRAECSLGSARTTAVWRGKKYWEVFGPNHTYVLSWVLGLLCKQIEGSFRAGHVECGWALQRREVIYIRNPRPRAWSKTKLWLQVSRNLNFGEYGSTSHEYFDQGVWQYYWGRRLVLDPGAWPTDMY